MNDICGMYMCIPSLSNNEKASLNSAICSSVKDLAASSLDIFENLKVKRNREMDIKQINVNKNNERLRIAKKKKEKEQSYSIQ